MDNDKLAYFLFEYKTLDEEELVALDKRRDTLADEAVSALDAVFVDRGLDRVRESDTTRSQEFKSVPPELGITISRYAHPEIATGITKVFCIVVGVIIGFVGLFGSGLSVLTIFSYVVGELPKDTGYSLGGAIGGLTVGTFLLVAAGALIKFGVGRSIRRYFWS